jgi:hypothetical protein
MLKEEDRVEVLYKGTWQKGEVKEKVKEPDPDTGAITTRYTIGIYGGTTTKPVHRSMIKKLMDKKESSGHFQWLSCNRSPR